MNGQRALEDPLRNHVLGMDPSVHVFPKRNQRSALVCRVRHARLTDRRRGHGSHNENAEEVRLGMTGSRRGDIARVTFRFHGDSVPRRRRTCRHMVPHVQSVPLLTPLPSRHGVLMSGHLRGDEKDQAFVPIRRRFRRHGILDFRLPLERQGSRRFRVFVANRSIPVPFGPPLALIRTAHGSVYEKNRPTTRQPTFQMDSETFVFDLPVPRARHRNPPAYGLSRRSGGSAAMVRTGRDYRTRHLRAGASEQRVRRNEGGHMVPQPDETEKLSL